MFQLIYIFVFIPILFTSVLTQTDRELIRNKYAYCADKSIAFEIFNKCINGPYNHREPKDLSRSMETLIDYIERLEEVLANTTDQNLRKLTHPIDVARLILLRFNIEDISLSTMEYANNIIKYRCEIDTEILGKRPTSEYFPDYIYSEDEQCSMLFMFSHLFVNNTRSRQNRKVFTFPISNNQMYSNKSTNLIYENGVVAFRGDQREAIAPAKVLIGIISGLTKEYKREFKIEDTTDVITIKNPFLTTTIANMPGTSVFLNPENDGYYRENFNFGTSGTWIDSNGHKNYLMNINYNNDNNIKPMELLLHSSRGSLAQIRGAIDGYIIGNYLSKLDLNKQRLRLSNILRSYYSLPQLPKQEYSVSYCDRSNGISSIQSELANEISNYVKLFKVKSEINGPNYKEKYEKFSDALNQASYTIDVCNSKRPSNNLDDKSPCETPSDLIFIIDPKREKLNRTFEIMSDISRKINQIGKYAGTVSVFINSNTKPSDKEQPNGNWPLGALVFNATNIGSLEFLIQSNEDYPPQTNFGKFYRQLNETILNYKWWTPKRFSSGVSSKNFIIIDHNTIKQSSDSKDQDDYNYYKYELKWRNPDVQYLIVSDNKKFEDILYRNDHLYSTSISSSQTNTIANEICNNPATLIYNDCYTKPSEGVVHTNYISPGYKQNWVMYPEYFHRSFDIQFKIKAYDGSIKFCYERKFPPTSNCKDVPAGSEELVKLENPCHYQSVESCDPFYFTIWGKDSTKICDDIACNNLNQIKFSITHTGISCNSSLKLAAIFFLQLFAFLFTYTSYNYFL